MAANAGRGRRPGWSTAAQEIVNRLFVYGTLRTGQTARSMIADHVVSSRPATSAGTLYALPEGYPGFVAGSNRNVVGEIVVLKDLTAAFLLLDAYEGDDFQRNMVKAVAVDGSALWCWVYVLRDPALAAASETIDSGDWTAYQDNH